MFDLFQSGKICSYQVKCGAQPKVNPVYKHCSCFYCIFFCVDLKATAGPVSTSPTQLTFVDSG